jgi:soluble lytic murein transglycosylase-like protein
MGYATNVGVAKALTYQREKNDEAMKYWQQKKDAADQMELQQRQRQADLDAQWKHNEQVAKEARKQDMKDWKTRNDIETKIMENKMYVDNPVGANLYQFKKDPTQFGKTTEEQMRNLKINLEYHEGQERKKLAQEEAIKLQTYENQQQIDAKYRQPREPYHNSQIEYDSYLRGVQAQDEAKYAEKAGNQKRRFGKAVAMQAWSPAITAASHKYGVPYGIAMGVMAAESGGNSKAISPVGAVGLYQFMPDTAKAMGINPYDPMQNIDGGMRYLRQNYEHFKRKYPKANETKLWTLAVAAHNAGPGNAEKAITQFKETRAYVPKVMQYAQQYSNPVATGRAVGESAREMLGVQAQPGGDDLSFNNVNDYNAAVKRYADEGKQELYGGTQDKKTGKIYGKLRPVKKVEKPLAIAPAPLQNEFDQLLVQVEEGKIPRSKVLQFINKSKPNITPSIYNDWVDQVKLVTPNPKAAATGGGDPLRAKAGAM